MSWNRQRLAEARWALRQLEHWADSARAKYFEAERRVSECQREIDHLERGGVYGNGQRNLGPVGSQAAHGARQRETA